MSSKVATAERFTAERLHSLIELTEVIARERGLPQLFQLFSKALHRVADFDAVYLAA